MLITPGGVSNVSRLIWSAPEKVALRSINEPYFLFNIKE